MLIDGGGGGKRGDDLPGQPRRHGAIQFQGQGCSGIAKGRRPAPGHPGNVSQRTRTSAFWNNFVYFIADGDSAKAFRLTNGLLSTSPVARSTNTFKWPGSTPSISANGAANGILLGDRRGRVHADRFLRPPFLHAHDASNISRELYDSSQSGVRDAMPLGVKFTVPTVANGKVLRRDADPARSFRPLATTNWEQMIFRNA